MVGIEGVTGAQQIAFGMSALLIVAGAVCAYAAVFWQKAKSILSDQAQNAVGNFARSAATKAVLLFALLISIILSPFVEQLRWPFSYPIDPKIINENSSLKNQLEKLRTEFNTEKQDAEKWRFVHELWVNSQTTAGPPECRFQIQYSARAQYTVFSFWRGLLQNAGWAVTSMVEVDDALQPGITIRSSSDAQTLDRGRNTPLPSFQCASALQKSLSDYYPNPLSKIMTNQATPFLSSCARECVQVDIDF